MENDIYQILGVVADVLPARGVQVQFALTHTLIQSLLIIMLINHDDDPDPDHDDDDDEGALPLSQERALFQRGECAEAEKNLLEDSFQQWVRNRYMYNIQQYTHQSVNNVIVAGGAGK